MVDIPHGKFVRVVNWMSDLISRADAIDTVEELNRKVNDDPGHGTICTPDVLRRINALPSADAVEVVRCKDCRHRCKEPIYSKADPHWVFYQIGDCPIICKTVSDDDYCSWGERSEP